jgi:3-oxoacyl-[acyl-carrier protein] reductase
MPTLPEDYTVLVTGARSGLGRYLAEDWLHRGARVVGCSREPTNLKHASYTHFVADVSNEQSVRRMFADMRNTLGRLDVLVNNAGIMSSSASLLTSANTAAAVFNTNFHGTFLCSREASTLMKKGRYGRIINVSSISVLYAFMGNAIYGASKAAVEHFTRVHAKEVVDYGITVNAVGLPPVEGTGMVADLDDAVVADAVKHTVLKRRITLEEAAHAIQFLADANSNAITGQTIYLGGC